jgi:hypothetical protein
MTCGLVANVCAAACLWHATRRIAHDQGSLLERARAVGEPGL